MEKPTELNYLDIEALAASISDTESEESSVIEQALYDKFGIDFENFEAIMQALFEKMDFGFSNLGDQAYVGFSEKEDGFGSWIIKKNVTDQFFNSMIEFMHDGDEFKPETKGFIREITLNGIPEFKLIITKPDYEVTVKIPEKRED